MHSLEENTLPILIIQMSDTPTCEIDIGLQIRRMPMSYADVKVLETSKAVGGVVVACVLSCWGNM